MAKFLFGKSRAMNKIKESLQAISESDLPILIEGETGTGKSLFAKQIHRLSGRASGEFVKLDCATLPSNLVESELF